MKPRVFSGIQPTGAIHIGNYLGAIKNWAASQADYDNIFCIVDLHAITVPQDPRELRRSIRQLAGLLFACGIDPQQSTLFVQSQVAPHSELTWILNCITPIGWLQRMTQFKVKSEREREQTSAGLFDYPVLMASDILLYDTDAVPVGEDQRQHLELSRNIAQRFNHLYGEVFKLPRPIIPEAGARIMGLDDPTKKMSKSEDAWNHAINLLDTPDDIALKVRRATTDSQRAIVFDASRPGVYNLLEIYQLFTGRERTSIEEHFRDQGYAVLKRELAEVVVEGLRPIQERYHELTSDPAELEALLDRGADRLRPVAEQKVALVKERAGLG